MPAVSKGEKIFLFSRVLREIKISSNTIQFVVLEWTSARVLFCFILFSVCHMVRLQWVIFRPCIKTYKCIS
jgi:hypothetical protein